MKFAVILLLGALVALSACKSSEAGPAPAAVRCTCGTPETDFEGCSHPVCLRGERNPNNPDCVCGPLNMGGGK